MGHIAWPIPIGDKLSNSPMDANIVFDMVDHLDQHCVILPSINGRTREPSIHSDNGLSWAQSRGILQYNLHIYIYIYISIYVTLLAILANTNRKLISLTVTFMGMVLGSVKFGVFSQPHHSTTKFAVSSRFLSHPYIFFSLFIEPVTQQIKRIFLYTTCIWLFGYEWEYTNIATVSLMELVNKQYDANIVSND